MVADKQVTAVLVTANASPTLGHRLEGLPNNFGLARLVAALIVVLSHAFPLAGRAEPAGLTLFLHNHYLGNYPVQSFFVISGLLVTQSYLSGKRRIGRFVVARSLRLYPALICGVVLSVALGVLCNELPASVALIDPTTWTYFWGNVTAWRFEPLIRGAFPGNPLPDGPNGSLWSLPIELRMYVLVGVLGVAGVLMRRRVAIMTLVALMAVLPFVVDRLPEWLVAEWQVPFIASFVVGMLAYLLRYAIPLSFKLAAVLLLVYAGFATWGTAKEAAIIFAVFLPYWLLLVTCHPAIKVVRLPGDYSYGIYLYAFPIQQCIYWLMPGQSMGLYIVLTLFLICSLAIVSWHLVELPMLRLKPRA